MLESLFIHIPSWFSYGPTKRLGCLLAALLILPYVGCTRSNDQNLWSVSNTRLRLPKKQGWQQDPELRRSLSQSGVLLRLVRENAVAGSPRIEVVGTLGSERPHDLEAYLAKNLADMAQLEASGQVHILHVEQHRTWVADIPAYRIHHEYALGVGSQQVSLYQISTCLVLDGQGVTVTAAGRTELFHPLARAVADVIDAMTLAPKKAQRKKSERAPINLGRVGGGQPTSDANS